MSELDVITNNDMAELPEPYLDLALDPELDIEEVVLPGAYRELERRGC